MAAARHVLPTGTLLDRKYEIDRVIGMGGFGITYAAHDVGLSTTVAVKEFYPAVYAVREDTMTVRPRSGGDKELFDHLRAGFVREAQTLIKFRNPAIVRVLSVFEAHGTAYMVMEFEQGETLKAHLAQLGRPLTEDEIDSLLMPLLDALETVHKANFLHRDLAPDNIIIRQDGSPVLLDFGAARQVTGSMTGIVKSGYSPQEQYVTGENSRLQGPWTDIYALGATLYHAITGRAPQQSTERALDDRTQPLATRGLEGYRPELLAGIDAAMRTAPKDRPQSVADLRRMIYPRAARGPGVPRSAAVPAVGPVSKPTLEPATTSATAAPPSTSAAGSGYRPWAIAAACLAVALLGYKLLGSRSAAVTDEQKPIGVAALPSDAGKSGDQLYKEGNWYLDGEGVTQDYKRALALFQRGADLGHAASMNQIGQIYFNGWGVQQSHVTARQWYERAIQGGNASAMNNLGLLYEKGQGVSQDIQKALEWYRKAAEAGDTVAMENIATVYNDGRPGIKQDYPKALEWYLRAANAGQASSMNWVGRFYQEGWGTAKDLSAARKWFQKAAEAGDASGMWNLAVLLDEASGGPANPVQASRWLLGAAKAGHEDARTNLSGDMANWAKATRVEIKRDLTRRSFYSGPADDNWNDAIRQAVEAFLAP